ncbi:MAG: DNA polymerase III subunit delta' [Candidatus Omnitrophica bacterium]|nr:DNA polymerase III subunit delta' [Candidatus Omnitrophota bacterium]
MAFSDIKGQTQAIAILREALKQSRIPGGYLFSGPEGIGKARVAKIFAQALLCKQASADACGVCPSCTRIANNQHPDVHYITNEEAEALKIEAMRSLQRAIHFRPYEAEKKVFIIDNAHCLTQEAENSILKILEEPPADSVIILISAQPQRIAKTIISRCQGIKFCALPRLALEKVLKHDFALSDTVAHFLAYFCEGRIGAALRYNDSDFMEYKNHVLDEMVFAKHSASNALLFKEKADIRQCLLVLISWFRDLYLLRAGITHAELIHRDRRDELLARMQQYSSFELDEILQTISDTAMYLEQNINSKLLLLQLKGALWNK